MKVVKAVLRWLGARMNELATSPRAGDMVRPRPAVLKAAEDSAGRTGEEQ